MQEKAAGDEMTENKAVGKEIIEKEIIENEMADNEAAGNEEIENEAAENETGQTETVPAEAKADTENSPANRGVFLKCVAGVYLIYTAYELGNSYFRKEEGSSFGFFIAGILFGIIGVFLLYIVLRDFLRENRQKKAGTAAVQREVKSPEQKNQSTVSDAPGQQKMSISQRAHLVEDRMDKQEE